MSPEKLLGELLGLGLSWRVTECVFSRPEGRADLRFENTDEVWRLERCPKCGGKSKGYDHTEELRRRHLDVMQHRCEIACRLPCGHCPGCGPTWGVRPSMGGHGRWLQQGVRGLRPAPHAGVPVSRVAKALGVTDGRLGRLLDCHMNAASHEAEFSNATCVGVDEMSVRKEHLYISVFADLTGRRLLFAAKGRDAALWPAFLEDLEARNGHQHTRLSVSQDMSPAYPKGVRDHCRNAEVIHDKYHVIANLIAATAGVRRREQRTRPELKGARWAFRKNPGNLSEEQRAELGVLRKANLATMKAYPMRLAFQDAYPLETVGKARRRLHAWCQWVRRGVRHFGVLFKDMERFVQSAVGHMAGILAHWKGRITDAFLGGLNSVFSAVTRRARGFRSPEYPEIMLYFVAGKLRLPAIEARLPTENSKKPPFYCPVFRGKPGGQRGLFESSVLAAALAQPHLGQGDNPGATITRPLGLLDNGQRPDVVHPLCEPTIPQNASVSGVSP